jgi:hypothetical protein
MPTRKLMMHTRRIWILVVALMSLAATVALGAAGCGVGEPLIVYDCNYPIVGRMSQDGQHDDCCHIDACPCHCLNDPCPDESAKACHADAGADASLPDGATSACSGSCVPLPPAGGWEGPFLFSLSPEDMEPPCPAQAPIVAYQGHDGLLASPTSCGTCTCSTPSGTCAPPLTLTASSTPCVDTSGMTASFNGPAVWDGDCTAQDCISQAPSCSQALSVQSLTAGPLVLTEEACTPTIVIPQDVSMAHWTTAALACRGMPTAGFGCSDPGQTCVPIPVPPEFSLCIYHEGDVACPSSYADKHVVYAGVDDQRTCSACACGAPGGGTCTAALSVFKDGACTAALLGSLPISSLKSSCVDLVPAGLPLGSKTVTALAYQAGNCMPSGGEPQGALLAADASTFCCLMG